MGSSSCGQRRLSSTGATNKELLKLITRKILSTNKPQTAQRIADLIQDENGRVVSHRRVAMLIQGNLAWVDRVSDYMHHRAYSYVVNSAKFTDQATHHTLAEYDRYNKAYGHEWGLNDEWGTSTR